ncbi:MAG: isocitrate/isopropylmalate family dehydrogenase [Bacillota bacterium]
MSHPRVVVLRGDGMGPELCDQALETLETLCALYGFSCQVAVHPCGAQYWQEHGEEYPPEAWDDCQAADAILFGGVGLPGVLSPSGDLAGVKLVFQLRRALGLYANVRPVEAWERVPGLPHPPGRVKLHLVREMTEGLYSRIGGRLAHPGGGELAMDLRVVSSAAVERIARFAFRLAAALEGEHAREVTCVDKSNVLEGCRLFRATVRRVAEEFPHLGLKFAYVDNFALDVLRQPWAYSVCVTSNAFGDILADMLAFLEGGAGVACSGTFGDERALFEPLHGPLPAQKGKGTANPVAIHRCLAMLLEWLGRRCGEETMLEASRALLTALREVMRTGTLLTTDLGGRSTTAVVCGAIRRALWGAPRSNP